MPKIGLEIHQRLEGKKLFCNCEARLSDNEPNARILRRLRAVLSETGEKDIAALYEEEKDMWYEYEYFDDVCCLVELDEEPPHEINKIALARAITYAKILNMHIFNRIKVMRKIVIDGSNTSGFQRTALLAINGYIDSSYGKVGIESLCLEEESAGIVGIEGNKKIYRLDRLGIPLVEIATDTSIKNGKHCKEVAERIGMMLRLAGGVARGIGTIRQDVNVSIEGGNRVEIKGAQELGMIDKIVDKEIERQTNLLKVIEELKKRNAYDALKRQGFVVIESRALTNPPSFLQGKKLFVMKLPRHKGILGAELTKGKRYGSELADYARVFGVKGLIHSDEDLSKYGVDVNIVKEELKLTEDDAFVGIAGEKVRAVRALYNVFRRALMDYVPKETRKALKDGNSAYLRPLPGSARMYPETDIPEVDIKIVEKNVESMINVYKERERFLSSIQENYKKLFVRSEFKEEILKFANRGFDKDLLLWIFLNNSSVLEPYDDNAMEKALELYKQQKITKKALLYVYRALREGKDYTHYLKFDRNKLKELLKTMNIQEIMKKYPLNVDYNELKSLKE